MSEYHKIQTMFLRDPETNFKTLLEGQWALPEFEYLADNKWFWTEKVDGTNIRVTFDGTVVSFAGKTDNASIPPFLLKHLGETFTAERMRSAFPDISGHVAVILYGEGYGARIQGGGKYIPDGVGFILFDVHIGMWLEHENVTDIAAKLAIPSVPIVGEGTLREAAMLVKQQKNPSELMQKKLQAEGLVMRPAVEMLNRRGHRIITKIKAKDFRA